MPGPTNPVKGLDCIIAECFSAAFVSAQAALSLFFADRPLEDVVVGVTPPSDTSANPYGSITGSLDIETSPFAIYLAD